MNRVALQPILLHRLMDEKSQLEVVQKMKVAAASRRSKFVTCKIDLEGLYFLGESGRARLYGWTKNR
jgi:hypothetical protein